MSCLFLLMRRRRVHYRAYLRGLEQAEAFLESCIREIEDYWNETTMTRKSRHLFPQIILDNLFSKFHLVARQLCNRYNNRDTIHIVDEYDVQDLLYAMLRIFFDDIRQEEWTPSYAGKSSRMDFLLKDYKIVIEVKMTRKGIGAKEIGTQLIDDIARYRQHPRVQYTGLFCIRSRRPCSKSSRIGERS